MLSVAGRALPFVPAHGVAVTTGGSAQHIYYFIARPASLFSGPGIASIMFRKLYLCGGLAYVAMLVFSVLFYKERIILLDTAFTIFSIVKDSAFSIQVYRFGDVLTQWLPVLLRCSGASLQHIMLGYSIGFILFFAGCYVVCGSVLRQYGLALCVLLLNILFITDTFYWITSQLPQSIALFLVAMAFVAGRRSFTPISAVVAAALFITVAFFHPLAIFVVAYTLLFFSAPSAVLPARRVPLAIIGIYVAAVLLKALAFRTPYEQHALGGLRNFVTCFPDYFSLYSNQRFLVACLTRFCWVPITLALCIACLIRQRQPRRLTLLLCAFFGYLALINISYPTAATPSFYVESFYIPLSIFLALPFVFHVLPALHRRRLALPCLLLIIISGCVRMGMAHTTYAARLQYQRTFLARYPATKAIVSTRLADTAILQMTWGTPYELLLLSVLEQHRTASLIIDPDPPHRMWADRVTNALVVNWNIIPYSALPPAYFPFADTVTGYSIIK